MPFVTHPIPKHSRRSYRVGKQVTRDPWGNDRFNTNVHNRAGMKGSDMCIAAKPSRQRKKGPNVKFGGRIR